MAEEASGGAVNVGGIYYVVDVDTKALIEAERVTDKSAQNMAGSLTAVAQASKEYAAAAGNAADAARAAAKAEDAATKSTNDATKSAQAAAKANDTQAAAEKRAADAANQLKTAQDKSNSSTSNAAQLADKLKGGLDKLSQGSGQLGELATQGSRAAEAVSDVASTAGRLGVVGGVIAGAFAAAAAVVAAYVYALVKAKQETVDFTRSLELSGNQSGVTVAQLGELAKSLGSMAGIARGQAADGLNVMVRAGIQGADSLSKFTEAAIRLEKAGGQSVGNTAKEFEALGQQPVTASERLNQQVNFLTRDIYLQIRALDEQGKHVEAGRLAQNAYADAILDRAPKVLESLGNIEKAWNSIKTAVEKAKSAVVDWGRDKTLEDNVALLEKLVARRDAALSRGQTNTNQVAQLDAAIKALKAKIADEQQAQAELAKAAQGKADDKNNLDATKAWEDEGDRLKTSNEKMQTEIEAARNLGKQLGLTVEQINSRIAAIRQAYGADQKSDRAIAYYQSLVAATADALGKIDAEEQAALADNKKRAAMDTANTEIYAKAKNEIIKKYARERALVEETAQEQIHDLNIATTLDEAAKIDLIENEAVRRAQARAKLKLISEAEADRQITLTHFQAAQARAALDDRTARASADTLIAITQDQETRIGLVRAESLRSAKADYDAGKKNLAEYLNAIVKATVDAKDAIRALNNQRQDAVVATLQLKASAGGTDDQEALIRAQAAQQLRAVTEAQFKDLNQYQIYADQRAAIEADMNRRIAAMRSQANQDALMNTSQAFGAMVNVLQGTTAEQTGIFKVMFAAQKAFSIASSIVAIQTGIANAASLPFPANLAAMATVVAATASILSTIKGTEIAGGRQYGGATSAGGLYRVNETGAPEMFTASNGNQYMMSASNGRVTSADKLGGGPTSVTVQVFNNGAPVSASGSSSTDSDGRMLIKLVLDATADDIASGGKVARATAMRFNLKN